jgi:hypothetical protein
MQGHQVGRGHFELQDGVIRQRVPGWCFAGMQMCFTSFLAVTGISKRKCQKFVKAIYAGQREPPEDGRSHRVARDVPKRDHARSFFQFLYDHLAEPLAEGDPDPEPEEESELMDEFAYWVRSQDDTGNPVGVASSSTSLPQKWFGLTS